MTYAARGFVVCFSIFVLVYGCLSVAVCCAWRKICLGNHEYSARGWVDLIFAVRMLPFLLATAITLIFAVPSFLLFEPYAATEPIGEIAAVLGLIGIGLVLTGAWSGTLALVKTARTVTKWSRVATVICCGQVDKGSSVLVLRSSTTAAPLVTAGIWRTRVWLSSAAEFVLSERELATALRHELVHVRRRDNLRKLLLLLLQFPGMSELDLAWREAAEIAADDAAVSNASEALDLAAAVIKLSKLAAWQAPAGLTTALVHGSADSVNARVERLIAWTDRGQNSGSLYSLKYLLSVAAVFSVILIASYSTLLAQVHSATEWLMR